jgi:hypothetical protein
MTSPADSERDKHHRFPGIITHGLAKLKQALP